jgi:peroxiredoxin Q/BCP
MNVLKKSCYFCAALFLSTFALCGNVSADDDSVKIIYIRVGDEAPPITLQNDEGKVWKSSKFVGKKPVVVFFYLGDFMPKCTKQACSYRDELRKLKAYDVEVVGISGDSVANHEKFKAANKLNYPLLADVDGELAKSFGVFWSGPSTTKGKDADGKTVTCKRNITISRFTWIIGKDGKVIYKNQDVNPAEDVKQVLAFLEKEASKKE